MQQSRPPDADSKHRNVLQVSGGGRVSVPVWKTLRIIITQINDAIQGEMLTAMLMFTL